MKTLSEWEQSGLDLGHFLQVGDEVSVKLHDYLMEVVPPAYLGGRGVQCGEPHDHRGKNGAARYSTVARVGKRYIYLGVREFGDFNRKGGSDATA